MRAKAFFWLANTGRLWVKYLAATFIELCGLAVIAVIAFIIIAITMITTASFLGEEWSIVALGVLGAAALGFVYTDLAWVLWRNGSPCPPEIGRFRWLLTIYRECWRRGYKEKRVHWAYLVTIFLGVVVFTVGPLVYPTMQDVGLVATGLFTPILALTTFLTPLAGIQWRKGTGTRKG